MRRFLLPTVTAVAVVGLMVSPVQALRIMIAPQPDRLALTVPVVVTGKVTSIEKDTVDAAPFVNAPNKVAYKVAVVKIDKGLVGANNLTHIKIGFIPAPPMQPGQPGVNPLPAPPVGGPIRPGFRPGLQMPELKVDQESLFFLTKHPTADFYTVAAGAAPVDLKTDEGKKQLETVQKTLAIVADPMKGLKSDKAEVRLDTATKLLTKYRGPLVFGETEQVAIPAEESKLILKVLAEADWKAAPPVIGGPGGPGNFTPNAYTTFFQLGLTDKDGWKPPMFQQPAPGAPPIDYVAVHKDAFVKWLAGAGKDYVIKKIVSKPAK